MHRLFRFGGGVNITCRPKVPRRVPREMRAIAEVAVEFYGWRVELAAGCKHVIWFPPESRKSIQTSLTPSDQRTHSNEKSRLRRAGLPIPNRGQRWPHELRRRET